MLNSFPKTRPSLPSAYQKIYDRHYRENRLGCSRGSALSKRLESWMHRAVAEDTTGGRTLADISTLEIGAGTLNHLPYEPRTRPYDIVEPKITLWQNSPAISRVRDVYQDINEIPIKKSYTRIISIAVLEHLIDLPGIVARSGVLLRDGGCFRAGIPNEGTLCWRLAYMLSTGIEFRLRYGLDYRRIMEHEHINTADEIEAILRYFFKTVRYRKFGISKRLAFYRFYVCQNPDRRACQAYL